MSEYAERRKRLWEKVRAQGVDAFLIVNVEGSEYPNLRYLTGFTGTFGVLILAENALFLTDPRYTEQAQRQVDLPVVEVRGRWIPQLIEKLQALGAKRIGLGSQRTTLHLFEELRKAGEGLEFVPLGSPVEELRKVKTETEIQRIKEAVELTEAGLRWILGQLRPGMTEREVALELEFWYRKEGTDHVAFELIVAAGPNSAMPHYRGGPCPLRRGEVVLFDIGARVDGYCADLTRVVALGKPDPEVQAAYKLVRAANEAGIKAIAAGARGKDVDAQARRVIEEAGLGERFGHGLGHGVGLEIHEGPRLSATSEDILETGNVVTVEPGVYFPGKFGIRIEDLVVVREKGAQTLSTFPKDELLVLAWR
ncbi:MAG: Xaa-Pro peptidase family protein [Candidatus Bipolaricaulota bacterium]|nr:Xaa-Pro peptidase family protein [Candidatus Bipolaricaulota bacterium]MDW8126239.1 Xaa-Pro peptidase family protein [Candidatus Bipolaricaulota bacterium]